MAFRSSAKASSSSGGTITATPTGVAAHDYLGATYLCDTNTGNLNVPSGWTNDQTNQWASGGPDGGRQFFAFKADASGTDGFGFSDTAGTASNALITAAWSGRDNSTPHSTARVKTLDTNSNTSPVSATITGITASAGDDIAVFMGADQTVAGGRWTFSTITGFTERQDGVATDWVSGIALDTQDNVAGGATGNFSTTITRGSGTGNTGYAAVVVAIKAASGGAQTVSPGAISSSEAFGTSQLNFGLGPFGDIASAEALGTAQLNFTILAAGNITSAEAFGTDQLNFTLLNVGNISSAEAFGTAEIGSQSLQASGIASAESFGAPQLNFTILDVGGISSAEAFGTTTVSAAGTQTLVPDGVASAETFGSSQLNFTLLDAGAIGSAEAFGTQQFNFTILGVGVVSEEAFGSDLVIPDQFIGASGIASAETFGSHVIDNGSSNWRLINAIELDSGRMLKLWLDLNQLN